MVRISLTEAPQGLLPMLLQIENYIHESGIDHKLLKLVKFRVSQMNHCAYCLDMHYKEALHLGEEPFRLAGLSAWREMPFYSEQERAVLAFAEALTTLDHKEDMDKLHESLLQYFNKAEIGYLTATVFMINGWNRLVRSFGTPAGTYKVPQHQTA